MVNRPSFAWHLKENRKDTNHFRLPSWPCCHQEGSCKRKKVQTTTPPPAQVPCYWMGYPYENAQRRERAAGPMLCTSTVLAAVGVPGRSVRQIRWSWILSSRGRGGPCFKSCPAVHQRAQMIALQGQRRPERALEGLSSMCVLRCDVPILCTWSHVEPATQKNKLLLGLR